MELFSAEEAPELSLGLTKHTCEEHGLRWDGLTGWERDTGTLSVLSTLKSSCRGTTGWFENPDKDRSCFVRKQELIFFRLLTFFCIQYFYPFGGKADRELWAVDEYSQQSAMWKSNKFGYGTFGSTRMYESGYATVESQKIKLNLAGFSG